jgi:hypothetical protein
MPEDSDTETEPTDGDRGTASDASGAADSPAPGRERADGGDVTRRWLIRLLVGLGIGVPVLVEARTLLGIASSFLFGDGGDRETTARATTERPTTGIGDELLPATEPQDTLAEASVTLRDDSRRFAVVVDVTNPTDVPYTLDFGTVTTSAGTRVGGGATSGRVEPGASQTVTAAWSLPVGEEPDTMVVAGVRHAADGDERVERTVELGDVPVRG